LETHHNEIETITGQLEKIDTSHKQFKPPKTDTSSQTQNKTNLNKKHNLQTIQPEWKGQINNTRNNGNTVILIEQINSTLNSTDTAHAFCSQFQIPQICLAESQTSWTHNNELKIEMKNSRIAEAVKKAIAFQMKIKTIKQEYVNNMFLRCHLPWRFYTPHNPTINTYKSATDNQ
jgi:hypothetical protein